MNAPNLTEHFRARQEQILEVIRQLVTQETPSRDKARLDRFAEMLAERYVAAGAQVELLERNANGNHVRVKFAGGATYAKPALVLCHYDTVWPAGSLETHPFRIEDGKAYGPGIFDMQSSLALVEFGLAAVAELGLHLPRPIVVLMTSDEEIGSESSRALIEAEAREAAYVLVMESPLPGGRLKTARKGTGSFTIEAVGRAAHAGVDPYAGVNAIEEIAHQVLAAHQLADRDAGTTVSAGKISGGTTTNVVPARATVSVDVRVWTQDEAARLEAGMHRLAPVLAEAQLVVSGGLNRPPLERSATGALFERVQTIGAALGMELQEGSTGGGSDGNFTGALGIPTLDGLGVPGHGAHADHEHILVDEIPQRAALLVAMWMGL